MHSYLKSSVNFYFCQRLMLINFYSTLSIAVWCPFNVIFVNTEAVPLYCLLMLSPAIAQRKTRASVKFYCRSLKLSFGRTTNSNIALWQIIYWATLVLSKQSIQFVRTTPDYSLICASIILSIAWPSWLSDITLKFLEKNPALLMLFGKTNFSTSSIIGSEFLWHSTWKSKYLYVTYWF